MVLAARLGGDGTRLAQCGGGCHAVPCLDGEGSQAAIAPCDAVGVLDLHHIPPQRILGHGCDLAGLGGVHTLPCRGSVVRTVVGAPVTQSLAVDQLIAAECCLRLGIPDPRSGGGRCIGCRGLCGLGRGGGCGLFGCGRRLGRLWYILGRLVDGRIRLCPDGIVLQGLFADARQVGNIAHNAAQCQNPRRCGRKHHGQTEQIQPFFLEKLFDMVHAPRPFRLKCVCR